MFVSVPVATRTQVCGGVDRIADAIAVIALAGWAEAVGMGSSEVPSIPLEPWMSGACTAGRMKGLEQPEYTGMEVRPMDVRMLRTL